MDNRKPNVREKYESATGSGMIIFPKGKNIKIFIKFP